MRTLRRRLSNGTFTAVFAKFADEQNWQGMKDMNVMDCVECRSCEFICSSKIPLVSKIKAGKNAIREMK